MAIEIVANYLEDNGFLGSIITENELTIIRNIIVGKNEIKDLDDKPAPLNFKTSAYYTVMTPKPDFISTMSF